MRGAAPHPAGAPAPDPGSPQTPLPNLSLHHSLRPLTLPRSRCVQALSCRAQGASPEHSKRVVVTGTARTALMRTQPTDPLPPAPKHSIAHSSPNK